MILSDANNIFKKQAGATNSVAPETPNVAPEENIDFSSETFADLQEYDFPSEENIEELYVIHQAQEYVIETYEKELEKTKEQFQIQDDKDGVINEIYNGVKEIFNFGISKSDVASAIEKQEGIVEELKQARKNGNFAEVYEKITGNKFDEEKLFECHQMEEKLEEISTSENPEEFKEEFEEIANKYKELSNNYLGSANELTNVLNSYADSQNNFIDKTAQVAQIGGMVAMVAGGVACFIPGGQIIGAGMIKAGQMLALGGTFGDNVADFIDTLTNKQGFEEDKEQYKEILKETAIDGALFLAGYASGSVASKAGKVVLESKKVVETVGKTGAKILSQITDKGLDIGLSLASDSAITGETISLDSLTSEGASQFISILTGSATARMYGAEIKTKLDGFINDKLKLGVENTKVEAQKIGLDDVEVPRGEIDNNNFDIDKSNTKNTVISEAETMTKLDPTHEYGKTFIDGKTGEAYAWDKTANRWVRDYDTEIKAKRLEEMLNPKSSNVEVEPEKISIVAQEKVDNLLNGKQVSYYDWKMAVDDEYNRIREIGDYQKAYGADSWECSIDELNSAINDSKYFATMEETVNGEKMAIGGLLLEQGGWMFRGRVGLDATERVSVNAKASADLINELDTFLATGKYIDASGKTIEVSTDSFKLAYKTPLKAQNWDSRQDPITIYSEKEITPEVYDALKTITGRHARGEVYNAQDGATWISKVEEYPSKESIQNLIGEIQEFSPELAMLLKSDAGKEFNISSGQFSAYKNILETIKKPSKNDNVSVEQNMHLKENDTSFIEQEIPTETNASEMKILEPNSEIALEQKIEEFKGYSKEDMMNKLKEVGIKDDFIKFADDLDFNAEQVVGLIEYSKFMPQGNALMFSQDFNRETFHKLKSLNDLGMRFDEVLVCRLIEKYGNNLEKLSQGQLQNLAKLSPQEAREYMHLLYEGSANSIKNLDSKFDLFNYLLNGEIKDIELVGKIEKLSKTYGIEIKFDNNAVSNSNHGSKVVSDEYLKSISEAIEKLKKSGTRLPETLYLTDLMNIYAAGVFNATNANSVVVGIKQCYNPENAGLTLLHEVGHMNDFDPLSNKYASDIRLNALTQEGGIVTYRTGKNSFGISQMIDTITLPDGRNINFNDIGYLVRGYTSSNIQEFVADISALINNEAIFHDGQKWDINAQNVPLGYCIGWSKNNQYAQEKLNIMMELYKYLTNK